MWRFLAVAGFVSGGLAAEPSVCGASGKVRGCDHEDLGSCGNACCYLRMKLPGVQPEEVYSIATARLNSTLDGTYSYVTGANPRTDPNTGEDVRDPPITKPMRFQFVFQGAHACPLYNGSNSDVLDFTVVATSTGSELYMFSLSRIHGALGDGGQNYKSLAYLSESLQFIENPALEVLYGCGQATQLKQDVQVPPVPDRATIGFPSVCGTTPGKVVDCDRADMGSCGNACCILESKVYDMSPADTYATLKSLLDSKIDGSFEYVTGGDPNRGDDLRHYNISKPLPYRFVFQGTHRLNNPEFLPDVLDFNIADMGSYTLVRYFSISRIHGALGDDGQNYKTLAFLIQQAPEAFKHNISVAWGCGSSSSAAEADILLI